MKVLMLGWEFPPFSSGGLGTACQGLTKALAKNNVDVTFVIPNAPRNLDVSYMKTIVATKYPGVKHIAIIRVDTLLAPYMSSEEYEAKKATTQGIYGNTIYQEVERYAEHAKTIAKKEKFDIIHAHDWMTYKAGVAAKKASKKPLVVHVHSTEFDRTGGNGNQHIYNIEREGMHTADSVIAVSNFTKDKIVANYSIPPKKIKVVHNAVEKTTKTFSENLSDLNKYYKLVLFLGRVTIQKGPDWFLYTAKKVLDQRKDVKFIVAGRGDMEQSIIEKSAELGIAENIIFAGFVPNEDLDKVYQMADIYVMPSISEPFGITPLEAMRNKTPVIISKQSGVSEVIKNCIKTDFWDTQLTADKIVHLLDNKKTYNKLKTKGYEEVQKLSWNTPAKKCLNIYKKVVRLHG